MNKALRQIFWGYLFIFFQLHVFIDLFMDPIGYYLIFAGCSKIVDGYPMAKKANTVGLIGMFVTVPSVFVNLMDPAISDGWNVYAILLSILKLIVVFYLFILLTDIAKVFGDQALQKRTDRAFKFYFAIHLMGFALQSFSANMFGDGWTLLIIVVNSSALIMEFVFLFLIGNIRKVSPSNQLRINTFV